MIRGQMSEDDRELFSQTDLRLASSRVLDGPKYIQTRELVALGDWTQVVDLSPRWHAGRDAQPRRRRWPASSK